MRQDRNANIWCFLFKQLNRLTLEGSNKYRLLSVIFYS